MTAVSIPQPAATVRSPGRRRYLAAGLAAVVALAAIGVIGWRTIDGRGSNARGAGPPAAEALDVRFPSGWSAAELTDVDRRAGVVARADRRAPAGTFLARAVVGELEADVTLAALGEQTEQALARSLVGFQLVQRDVTELAGRDGVRIDYRQPGDGGAGMRTAMVIVPQPQRTYYLSVRAADAEFAQVGADALLAAAAAAIP
jgi:hypothetical protein